MPGQPAKISRGVEGERKEGEGNRDAGQGLLAVPKVVLKIVSVGLEHVEGLVLDLPARPAAGSELGDGPGRYREIGDKAVVVGPFSLGIEGVSMENQLTVIASSVARSGTVLSQR